MVRVGTIFFFHCSTRYSLLQWPLVYFEFVIFQRGFLIFLIQDVPADCVTRKISLRNGGKNMPMMPVKVSCYIWNSVTRIGR